MPSEELLADLRRDEGLRLKAYPDPLSSLAKTGKGSGHPWTIGYGHAAPDVSPGQIWTKPQAETALVRDVERHAAELLRALPWVEKLGEVRKSVLINMAFNLGVDGLLGFKNTLARIKSGDFEGASEGMAASLWAKQTGGRAKRLVEMMRTGKRS